MTSGASHFFTFDAWKAFTRAGFSKSSTVKLFTGLPASTNAADMDDEGRPYYLDPKEALKLIRECYSHGGFSGVMLYDAGTSDANVVDGCTYSQQIRHILDNSTTC